MNRGHLLGLAVLVLLALAGVVFYRVLREDLVARRARPHPVVKPIAVPEASPARAGEPRALAPAGRIVESLTGPGSGWEVLLGEEKALVGADGTFAFPGVSRPRCLPLRVLRRTEEISRWSSVVTGDPDPSTSPADSNGIPNGALSDESVGRAPEDSLIPEQPERIRWTINLTAGLKANEDSWIRLQDVLVEDWGNGLRVRVQGTTRLPDGAHIQTSLYFDEERTIADTENAVVNSRRFEACMTTPQPRAFFSGIYEVRSSFGIVLEAPSLIEEWQQAYPEVDWNSLQVPEARRQIFAGSVSESREQDDDTRAYYTRVLDEARRLERALKLTLNSRVDERRVFIDGKRPRMRSGAEASAWLSRDYLTPEGTLDEPKWRKFLDEQWRPKLRALLEVHASRGQEKYMRASALLTNLLAAIQEESYGYSKFVVYPALGLEAHPNDFYVDEERAGDLVRLEKVVVSCFAALERFRHLGE